MTRGYEVLRIKDPLLAVVNILRGHRIDVMNQQPVADLMSFDTQITPSISNDHFTTSVSPIS